MDDRTCLTAVLKSYLHGEDCPDIFSSFDYKRWESFSQLAWQHMVLPVVCSAVHRMPSFEAWDAGQALYRNALHMAVQQAARTQTLLRLLPRLEAAGVRYMLLKGLCCRVLYAVPELRPSSDEDLFLPKEDAAACLQVLEQMGYRREDPQSDHAWRSPDCGLRLELSFGELFPQTGELFSAWDRVFSAVSSEQRQTFQMHGQTVYTLPYTENMLYLLVHALKHFIHSGVGIRQLMDIAAFAKMHGDSIDWVRLFALLDAQKAGAWARSMFALCRNELGLDTRLCGVEQAVALPDAADSLLHDLLDAGVYGQSSAGRLHSGSVTLGAVSQKKHPFLQACFPSAAVLRGRYPYVRFPLLLPVAWVHRALRYFGVRHKERRNGCEDSSVTLGIRRMELMREYGLL